MKFQIKHRWAGSVLFEADLEARYESERASVQMGAAIKLAFTAKADLNGANLSGADLRGAFLSGANLRGADLRGADLREANLNGADLCEADLSGAFLCEAYLSGADLSGAYVCGAYLSGTNLSGADLCEADLSGAFLCEAYLSGADLSGAYLSGTNLSGADLCEADLSGAYVCGAKDVIAAGYPDGWAAFGWHRDGALMLRVGCRTMSLAEGREYWAGKSDRREVLAALDYIEAVARLRGWPVFSTEPKECAA